MPTVAIFSKPSSDLDIESLLNSMISHSVERVCAQVVGEACFGTTLRLLDTQFVDDDLDNFD